MQSVTETRNTMVFTVDEYKCLPAIVKIALRGKVTAQEIELQLPYNDARRGIAKQWLKVHKS